MAPPSPSPVPVTPQKPRSVRASDLLAQFGSAKSYSSVTKSRKLSHIFIDSAPSSPPPGQTQTGSTSDVAKEPSTLRRSISVQNLQTSSGPGTGTEELDRKASKRKTATVVKPVGVRSSARQLRTAQSAGDLRTSITLDPYKNLSQPRNARHRNTERILVSDTTPSVQTKPRHLRKPPALKPDTDRVQVRHNIEMGTNLKRDSFLLAHSDVFLPLLPPKSYISKLRGGTNNAALPGIDPYEELQAQPDGITADLKPYQLSGLSFLIHMHRNGMPAILGDEMGLGKTLQTISLMQFLEESKSASNKEEQRPYLVICPLSVLSSWVAEIQRWSPSLKVLRFHGTSQERARLKKVAVGLEDRFGNELAKTRKARKMMADQEGAYKVILTTYDVFVSEKSWFSSAFAWKYAILDEGHKIKNSKTDIANALQGIRAEYRLILTGTPLQNNMTELWSLFHWLLPEVFTEKTSEVFTNSFNLTKGQVNTSFLDHARQLLELLMLRRLKSSPGVNLGLPPKEEVLLYVPLSPMQKFWYTRLLTKAGDALLDDIFTNVKEKEKHTIQKERTENEQLKRIEALDATSKGDIWEESKEIMRAALEQEQDVSSPSKSKTAWARLMNLILQLRKCCSHPYLIPNVAPDKYMIGEHVIQASGKFIVLRKLLEDLIVKKNKKVLIFSGFTGVLDCVEDLLVWMGGDGSVFKYLRLDGSTNRARRNLNIRLFNDTGSAYKLMLISTKAGGLGINLATASDVVFLDQDWNPQQDLQAEARAHRIGQTQPVTIYKLCTQGTVEEQMLGRIRKKLYLSAKITESMKSSHSELPKKRAPSSEKDDMPQLSVSELKTLVRRGAQTLSHPQIDVDEMISWDIETLLQKCRDKPSDPTVNEQASVSSTDEEEKWLSSMERVQTAVFEGKRYHRQVKKEETQSILPAEITRQDRRKGKNTTVMMDGYEVTKESLLCADWEAVPTLAGKDPRLADIKREKRAAINNQAYCHVCWDGGDMLLCNGCPRAYHASCLDADNLHHMQRFNGACPQHECFDCRKKATDAGGMIYRCRWCPNGYCEDCIDWKKTTIEGESLPEFEMLSFGAVTQAYFITCHACFDRLAADKKYRTFVTEQTAVLKTEHDTWLAGLDTPVNESEAPHTTPGFLSTGPASETATISGSEVPTPQYAPSVERAGTKRAVFSVEKVDDLLASPKKKRNVYESWPH